MRTYSWTVFASVLVFIAQVRALVVSQVVHIQVDGAVDAVDVQAGDARRVFSAHTVSPPFAEEPLGAECCEVLDDVRNWSDDVSGPPSRVQPCPGSGKSRPSERTPTDSSDIVTFTDYASAFRPGTRRRRYGPARNATFSRGAADTLLSLAGASMVAVVVVCHYWDYL